MRKINKTYTDPLSLVWTHAASKMGISIERSCEVNASWDGAGVLTIGTSETLDPDDCLAQMVLHEICHALCEGPECLTKIDWGLDNTDRSKRVNEHACLRLQAALADEYDLRCFFAATTMFRVYYDSLPDDPFEPGIDQQDLLAVQIAQSGWERAKQGPWAMPLEEALCKTAQIAQSLQGATTQGSLWHGQGMSVKD